MRSFPNSLPRSPINRLLWKCFRNSGKSHFNAAVFLLSENGFQRLFHSRLLVAFARQRDETQFAYAYHPDRQLYVVHDLVQVPLYHIAFIRGLLCCVEYPAVFAGSAWPKHEERVLPVVRARLQLYELGSHLGAPEEPRGVVALDLRVHLLGVLVVL